MNVRTVIKKVEELQEPNRVDEATLTELGAIIAQSTDATFRSELAASNELCELIELYLTSAVNTLECALNIRIFRGVLLLVRNINGQVTEFSYELILRSLIAFSRNVNANNSLYAKTLLVYYQVLANMSQTKQPDLNPEDVALAFKVAHTIEDAKYPFMMALNNLCQNSNNLYNMLRNKSADSFILLLTRDLKDVNAEEELAPYELQLITCLSNLVTHESFGKWLAATSDEDFVEVIESARVIITSVESWDNYQLTAMLTWILHSYQRLTKIAMSILPDHSTSQAKLDKLSMKFVTILDILTDISKFNQVKEFLLSYNAIEDFVYLLVLIHENFPSLNAMKQKNKQQRSFPSVKSYLIEIIAYLSHGSFEIQEKVRHLGALAVILSNCIIDDNNPFIKERAIVCLKFLLDKNPENQKFVASLEAKKTIDDDILKDVGYEVEVVDGKVQLKKNPNELAN